MKTRTKKGNKFDEYVEVLIKEFIKIPHFDLTQNDETAKSAFNRITFRIAEISSYRELVCNQFVPATNKAIFNEKQLILHSKYANYLNVHTLDFNETLFDTIRLAYVGLFHKIENFINDLISIVDTVFQPNSATAQDIAQWAKVNYKIDIKNWQTFPIIFKINWVCNCVKHKDGYPLKEPRPIMLSPLNSSERIRLTPEEFKTDCDLLIKLYPSIIQLTMSFGLIRSNLFGLDAQIDSPEIRKLIEEAKSQIDEKMLDLKAQLDGQRLGNSQG